MIGRTNASAGGGAPTTGDYLVRYIDIDGTVLKEQWVNSGQDATPPSNPNYDSSYLTFSAWSKSSTNITNHKDIGALYTTLNNKSYAFLSLTTASGVSPILNLNKTDASTLTIDWGDGNQTTHTEVGNFNTSHLYSTTGNYVISMWISSGTGNYTFGNGTNSTMFLVTYKYCLTKLYIGSNVVSLPSYSLYEHQTLEVVLIPSTLTTLNTYSFASCYKLKALVFSNNITSIPNYLVSRCYNIINVVFPDSISNFGMYAFQYCKILKYVVIPSVSNYTVGAYSFQYCYSLETIHLNNSIRYLSTSALYNCSAFKELIFKSGINSFQGTNDTLSALNTLDFPTTINEIGTFPNCFALTKVICRKTTVPLLGSSAFNSQMINPSFKIYVPDASVAAYKAAAGWSTYATQIYAISTM